MRNVDESCIAEVHEFKPDEIKQLPERFNISQPIFSRYLNINVSTIQKWKMVQNIPTVYHLNCYQLYKNTELTF